ncbi:MAG TPA: DinB family protein [Ferruginibacter sp.]|nr:DinB family protein [Ferruginibacter sp.]
MDNLHFFRQCWISEYPHTMLALKALPGPDKTQYRPSSKNRSAKELADHIVSHSLEIIEALETGIINLHVMAEYASTESAMATLESASPKIIDLLDRIDPALWEEKKIPLYVFGQKKSERTLSETCWTILFDIIHHRGQLSAYYRPMGAVQPSIYGPTAEMVEDLMAEMISH